MRRFFVRHQPKQSLRAALIAGLGGMIAIAVVGAATVYLHAPLLIAPFGATSVLLFSVPGSPLSQPINVIGGHIVAALVGLVLRHLLPNEWWAAALAVGVAIALMALLRVTHPPAGADPLVVFAADPNFGFLVLPVIVGAVTLVGVATVFHRCNGTTYPAHKA